jgi:hypothetical protein
VKARLGAEDGGGGAAAFGGVGVGGEDLLQGVEGGAAVGEELSRGLAGAERVEGLEVVGDVGEVGPAEEVEEGRAGLGGEGFEVEVEGDEGLEELFVGGGEGREGLRIGDFGLRIGGESQEWGLGLCGRAGGRISGDGGELDHLNKNLSM